MADMPPDRVCDELQEQPRAPRSRARGEAASAALQFPGSDSNDSVTASIHSASQAAAARLPALPTPPTSSPVAQPLPQLLQGHGHRHDLARPHANHDHAGGGPGSPPARPAAFQTPPPRAHVPGHHGLPGAGRVGGPAPDAQTGLGWPFLGATGGVNSARQQAGRLATGASILGPFTSVSCGQAVTPGGLSCEALEDAAACAKEPVPGTPGDEDNATKPHRLPPPEAEEDAEECARNKPVTARVVPNPDTTTPRAAKFIARRVLTDGSLGDELDIEDVCLVAAEYAINYRERERFISWCKRQFGKRHLKCFDCGKLVVTVAELVKHFRTSCKKNPLKERPKRKEKAVKPRASRKKSEQPRSEHAVSKTESASPKEGARGRQKFFTDSPDQLATDLAAAPAECFAADGGFRADSSAPSSPFLLQHGPGGAAQHQIQSLPIVAPQHDLQGHLASARKLDSTTIDSWLSDPPRTVPGFPADPRAMPFLFPPQRVPGFDEEQQMQQANFALATQFNLPTFGNRIPDGIHFQHLLQLPLAAPSTSAGARPENAVSHPAGVPSRQHPGIVPEQGFQDDSDLGRDWETSEYEDEFVELHERRIRTGLASRTVAMFFPTEAPRLSPPSPTGIDLSLGGTEFSDGSDLSGGFDSSDGVGSFDAYPAFTQASQQEQHSSATLCFPGDAQQIAAATAAALGFSVDNHILGGTNMNGPIPDGFGHFSDSSAALTPSTASNPSTASTLFSGTNRADIQHLHQASPQPALQVLHLPAAAPFEGDVILGRFDPLLGIGAASVQPAHQGQQILTTPLADASAVPALWLDAAVRAASGLPWPAGQAIRGFVGLLPSQGNGNPQPHEGEDVGSAGLGNPLSDYEDFTAQSMMPLGVLNFMSPDLAAQLSGGAEPDYLDDFFLFLPAQVDGEDDLPARLPKQRKAAQ